MSKVKLFLNDFWSRGLGHRILITVVLFLCFLIVSFFLSLGRGLGFVIVVAWVIVLVVTQVVCSTFSVRKLTGLGVSSIFAMLVCTPTLAEIRSDYSPNYFDAAPEAFISVLIANIALMIWFPLKLD